MKMKHPLLKEEKSGEWDNHQDIYYFAAFMYFYFSINRLELYNIAGELIYVKYTIWFYFMYFSCINNIIIGEKKKIEKLIERMEVIRKKCKVWAGSKC